MGESLESQGVATSQPGRVNDDFDRNDENKDAENEPEVEEIDDEPKEWDDRRRQFEAQKKKMQQSKRSKFAGITNERILFDTINYIDLEGKYHEKVPLASVLESFAKRKSDFTLVLVDANTATCRLFRRKEYEEHIRALRNGQEGPPSIKTLQISWNMGDNDLQYRLKKAVKYLQEESRVDIILGAKKAKLTRDRAEREAMVVMIRTTLAPYGYEWKRMSGGFPNAELWFQGFSKKEKPTRTSATMEPAGDSPVSVDWVNDLGEDKSRLSREELAAGRFQRRSKSLRREADRDYRKAFPGASSDAASEMYWKNLAVPNARERETSIPKSSPKETIMSAKRKNTEETKDQATARLSELEERLGTSEMKQQQKAQEKLKSVASQFTKLGSKSMFGGKLGGVQTKR